MSEVVYKAYYSWVHSQIIYRMYLYKLTLSGYHVAEWESVRAWVWVRASEAEIRLWVCVCVLEGQREREREGKKRDDSIWSWQWFWATITMSAKAGEAEKPFYSNYDEHLHWIWVTNTQNVFFQPAATIQKKSRLGINIDYSWREKSSLKKIITMKQNCWLVKL